MSDLFGTGGGVLTPIDEGKLVGNQSPSSDDT